MNNVMDIENVDILAKKMENLAREIIITYDDFKQLDLNNCYENESLKEKKDEIEENFFLMNNMQKETLAFIESQKEAYENALFKAQKELGDI